MTTPPQEQESLYYPYTRKTLASVRWIFAIAGIALLISSFWRVVVVIGFLFCCVIWLLYEIVFRSHRRRLEEILNHGRKLTAKIIGKTNDFRRRLSFFHVRYEFQRETIESIVCVPDPLFHRLQVEDPVEILVSPAHPKQCIVLG